MKTIVAFHIGRGGRFNNAGHKTFNPYVSSLQECFGDATIIYTDEDSNELPDEEWTLIDSGSNIILEGRDEIENEVGILEWDTIYDTDIVKYLDDCDDEELELIYKEYVSDTTFLADDIIDTAVASQGLRRVSTIKPYQCNADIFFTNGDFVSYSWDGMDEFTEDDITEWAESERIDPISIKRLIDELGGRFF